MAAEGGQQQAVQQLYHHPPYTTGFKTKQVCKAVLYTIFVWAF